MSHCAEPTAPKQPALAARDATPERAGASPIIALIGRPNVGKTSLYNRLTGSEAHVGNYPGVTVDLLEADVQLPGGPRATVTDLPGVYSVDLSADPDTDEGIARTFIASALHNGRPLVLLQVIDANQLALSLRLTRELSARPAPLLLVLTQFDVLRGEGRDLDVALLERELDAPVLAVSSRDPKTRDRVLRAAARLLDARSGGAKSRHPPRPRRPAHYDPEDLARRAQRNSARPDDLQRRRRERTARLDAILLHPALGPIIFLLLMTSLFAAVFTVADPLKDALDFGRTWLGARLDRLLGQGLISSFLVDGVLNGAGTVLTFLPQIVLLTIAMELLEATGYLARGAFLVDRLLRSVGLGGRAFVPMLTGHACAVPAIASTRVIRDPKERLTAILVIPLMTCSARIPTYSLLIGTFFAARGAFIQAAIFVGLYAFGAISGLFAAAVLRRSITRGKGLPLVLEMPAYRAPEARRVWRVSLRAAQRFLIDVGTLILVASIVLWGLLNIPAPARFQRPLTAAATAPMQVQRMNRSVAAAVGRALEPVTRPVGFDWRINVGLIGSFGARELMVSTMGVIFGIEDADKDATPLKKQIRDAKRPDGRPVYTALSGASLLAFFVLACQCTSTVAAIRRETRTYRWPVFVLIYTYVAAYLLALLVYQGGRLLGLG